ncbi:hypothetical protein PUR61_00220, partial [Streptomyces sp. BE20]|nr:hypothetical protein [Streptomyces sp. BE20]
MPVSRSRSVSGAGARRRDGGVDLDLDDGAEAFDAVVLATDPAGLRTLMERSPLLDDHELRACAAAVR